MITMTRMRRPIGQISQATRGTASPAVIPTAECNNPTTGVVALRSDSHPSHVRTRLFWLVAFPIVATAQRPDSAGPPTLHAIVQYALAKNPDIVTARLH